MEEDQLPVLFDNLKHCFEKLDDETIWTVMTMFPLDGNWDAVVINKLLELSGEEVPSCDTNIGLHIPASIDNPNNLEDDTEDVYPDTTLPMKSGGYHSDQNNLTKRNIDKEEMDWDEFDKDFKFDYKKKDNGINFERFSDTLSNMWNRMGSSSENNDGYEMHLIDKDKKKK